MRNFVFLIAVVLSGHHVSALAGPPLENSRDAINYVIESSGIKFSENVRVAGFNERKDGGLSWGMNLRDGDTLHLVRVTRSGKFKSISKQSDPESNNVAFWAAQPLPAELPIAGNFVPRAKKVLESFNPNFAGDTKRHHVIYSVCKPRRVGRKTRKPLDCRSVYVLKNAWRARMQIDLPDGRKKVKEVIFEDDQPVAIHTVSSYGKWRF